MVHDAILTRLAGQRDGGQAAMRWGSGGTKGLEGAVSGLVERRASYIPGTRAMQGERRRDRLPPPAAPPPAAARPLFRLSFSGSFGHDQRTTSARRATPAEGPEPRASLGRAIRG
jgi:hypothetical protein